MKTGDIEGGTDSHSQEFPSLYALLSSLHSIYHSNSLCPSERKKLVPKSLLQKISSKSECLFNYPFMSLKGISGEGGHLEGIISVPYNHIHVNNVNYSVITLIQNEKYNISDARNCLCDTIHWW